MVVKNRTAVTVMASARTMMNPMPSRVLRSGVMASLLAQVFMTSTGDRTSLFPHDMINLVGEDHHNPPDRRGVGHDDDVILHHPVGPAVRASPSPYKGLGRDLGRNYRHDHFFFGISSSSWPG